MPPSHTCARTAVSTYTVRWDYVGRHGADDYRTVFPMNCPVDSLWRHNLRQNATKALVTTNHGDVSLKRKVFVSAHNWETRISAVESFDHHQSYQMWYIAADLMPGFVDIPAIQYRQPVVSSQ